MGGKDKHSAASPEGLPDVLFTLHPEQSLAAGGLETFPFENIGRDAAEMPEGGACDPAAVGWTGFPSQGHLQVGQGQTAVPPVDPEGQTAQGLPGP